MTEASIMAEAMVRLNFIHCSEIRPFLADDAHPSIPALGPLAAQYCLRVAPMSLVGISKRQRHNSRTSCGSILLRHSSLVRAYGDRRHYSTLIGRPRIRGVCTVHFDGKTPADPPFQRGTRSLDDLARVFSQLFQVRMLIGAMLPHEAFDVRCHIELLHFINEAFGGRTRGLRWQSIQWREYQRIAFKL